MQNFGLKIFFESSIKLFSSENLAQLNPKMFEYYKFFFLIHNNFLKVSKNTYQRLINYKFFQTVV